MFLTNCDRSTTNYDKSALINKKTVSDIAYSSLLNLPIVSRGFPSTNYDLPENVSAVVVNHS